MAWKRIKDKTAKNIETFLSKKQTSKRKAALFIIYCKKVVMKDGKYDKNEIQVQ